MMCERHRQITNEADAILGDGFIIILLRDDFEKLKYIPKLRQHQLRIAPIV